MRSFPDHGHRRSSTPKRSGSSSGLLRRRPTRPFSRGTGFGTIRLRGGRVLIGCGGSASSAASPDTACIGYSVLEEYQNQGYATEAVRHLIPVLFSLPGIRQVMATTYPYLAASIRVLEKNGFVYAGENHNGEGIEEGTGVYLLKKPDEADKN